MHVILHKRRIHINIEVLFLLPEINHPETLSKDFVIQLNSKRKSTIYISSIKNTPAGVLMLGIEKFNIGLLDKTFPEFMMRGNSFQKSINNDLVCPFKFMTL